MSFLKKIWRGGGAKFNFAPGRQLPSLRHCPHNDKKDHWRIMGGPRGPCPPPPP